MSGPVRTELDDLMDKPVKVTIGGAEYEFLPLRFGVMMDALELMSPIIEPMLKDGFSIAALMSLNGERIIDLAILLSGQPREWVEQLPIDDVVRLANALYEVNEGFFAQRVTPALASILNRRGAQTGAQTAASAAP